jgi:hypothetical protein
MDFVSPGTRVCGTRLQDDRTNALVGKTRQRGSDHGNGKEDVMRYCG